MKCNENRLHNALDAFTNPTSIFKRAADEFQVTNRVPNGAGASRTIG